MKKSEAKRKKRVHAQCAARGMGKNNRMTGSIALRRFHHRSIRLDVLLRDRFTTWMSQGPVYPCPR